MTGTKNVSSVYEGQFWLAMIHRNKVWIIISVEEDLLHLPDIWLILRIFNWCPGQIKYKKRNFELSWGKSNLIVLSDLQLPLKLGLTFYFINPETPICELDHIHRLFDETPQTPRFCPQQTLWPTPSLLNVSQSS